MCEGRDLGRGGTIGERRELGEGRDKGSERMELGKGGMGQVLGRAGKGLPRLRSRRLRYSSKPKPGQESDCYAYVKRRDQWRV